MKSYVVSCAVVSVPQNHNPTQKMIQIPIHHTSVTHTRPQARGDHGFRYEEDTAHKEPHPPLESPSSSTASVCTNDSEERIDVP